MSNYYGITSINDLTHSGTKGQKWGRRQYQNEDGSLTPLGREHYGVGPPRGEGTKSDKTTGGRRATDNSIANNLARKTWNSTSPSKRKERKEIKKEVEKKYNLEDRNNAQRIVYDNKDKIRNASNEELKRMIDHLDLENQYYKKVNEFKQNNKSDSEIKKERRQQFLSNVVNNFVLPAAKDIAVSTGKKWAENALGLNVPVYSPKEQAEINKMWAEIRNKDADTAYKNAQTSKMHEEVAMDKFVNEQYAKYLLNATPDEVLKYKYGPKGNEKDNNNSKQENNNQSQPKQNNPSSSQPKAQTSSIPKGEFNKTKSAYERQKKESLANDMRRAINTFHKSGDMGRPSNNPRLMSLLKSKAQQMGYSNASGMSYTELINIMNGAMHNGLSYGTYFDVNTGSLEHFCMKGQNRYRYDTEENMQYSYRQLHRSTIYGEYYSINSLIHSGTKGQKWGVRNYQYEDGSLTPLGREHYGVGPARSANNKQMEKIMKDHLNGKLKGSLEKSLNSVGRSSYRVREEAYKNNNTRLIKKQDREDAKIDKKYDKAITKFKKKEDKYELRSNKQMDKFEDTFKSKHLSKAYKLDAKAREAKTYQETLRILKDMEHTKVKNMTENDFLKENIRIGAHYATYVAANIALSKVPIYSTTDRVTRWYNNGAQITTKFTTNHYAQIYPTSSPSYLKTKYRLSKGELQALNKQHNKTIREIRDQGKARAKAAKYLDSLPNDAKNKYNDWKKKQNK